MGLLRGSFSAAPRRRRRSAQGVRCGAGRNSFCITWDGLLRPCNTFPAIAQSVLELPFKAAWRQINAQVKEFPLPVECQGCAMRPIASTAPRSTPLTRLSAMPVRPFAIGCAA